MSAETTNHTPPSPPLSPVLRVGQHVYVSGQVPFDSAGKVVAGGIMEQMDQVLTNLEDALASAGAKLRDIVKTTVYLTDVKRDFEAMNIVYAQRFGEHRPTRTTVGAELAIEALVEVEAVAILPG